MKQVETKDGSVTFYNEHYQEHYHSTSGAEEEAVKKFAQPLYEYFKEKKEITLLDVCFGLGYNTAACLDLFSGKFNAIHLIALENDITILSKMDDVQPTFASYAQLRSAIKECLQKPNKTVNISIKGTKIMFTLLLGDAKTTVQTVQQADGVLFDPFSPKQHPEMWTKEFLQNIKKVMTPGAALTTYSCARTFRDTLRELDMEVVNGPCVGRKAPSTIGVKKDL